MKFTKISGLLLMVVLLLNVACGENGTAPVEEEETVTYGFQLYRFGTEFYGMWMFSSSEWMGVGADGAIVRYKSGDFFSIDSGVLNQFNDIWASGRSDIFVVGEGLSPGPGIILHYDGTSWTPMTHPATGAITGVFGLTSTNVYAVTSNGEILHYDGTSWMEVYDRLADRSLSDVWCAGLTNVIAVGESGGIIRWDGALWSEDSMIGDDFTSVWGTAYNNIYVCGGEQIWRYTGSWLLDESAAGWELEEIHGSGPDDIWAVGPGNDLVHWNGTSWTEMDAGDVGNGNDFHAVWGQSATDAWLLSDHGGVYRYDGADWNEINNSDQGGWQDMYGLSANDIYTVGGGTVMNWDGTNWSVAAERASYMQSVWCSGPSDIWTTGYTGSGPNRYVYHHDGTSWSISYTITGDFPWDIWGFDANNIWVCGENGSVHYFNGTTWTTMTAGSETLWGVWGISATDVVVVGGDGSAYRITGTTVTPMNTGLVSGIDLAAVYGTSATDIVTVGEAGSVYRFDGTSWSTETTGVFPILNSVWGSAPDNYWAVGVSGTVLRNEGSGWERVESTLNTENSLDCIWGSSANNVWIGGDSDHLLHWERR
jgi:hypothetical protein